MKCKKIYMYVCTVCILFFVTSNVFEFIYTINVNGSIRLVKIIITLYPFNLPLEPEDFKPAKLLKNVKFP